MSEKLSPLKTIRKYCLTCCCESVVEVRLCPAKDCALYAYRFGKTGRSRISKLTEEQKEASGERLAKWRETRKPKSL